jgi:Uma2 family endonuclease
MLTVTDFWAQYAGQPYELIGGEVSPLVQKGYLHEVVTNRVASFLAIYVEGRYLGEVLGTGARWALSPYDLRAADVAFIAGGRLSQMTHPDDYLPLPPDLVVEVVSPRYTSRQIQAKMEDFLRAGTPWAWIVDPTPKQVTVLAADGSARLLENEDRLQGGGLLPQFSVAVGDLFPPLDLQMKMSYFS